MRCACAAIAMLAACGFEHGAASTPPGGDDDDPIDAAQPGEDSGTELPDAMIDDSGGGNGGGMSWIAIETITVPASGMHEMSSTTLDDGEMYKLRVMGTFVIQNPPGTLADAEYWDFESATGVQDGVVGVDCGLAIDDTNVDANKTPKWGPYSANHMYEIDWMGGGQKIVAMIHDGNYSNNTGSLTLQILAYQ